MPKEQEAKEVIRRLRKEGWQERRGKGSHMVFTKDKKTVTVPTSKKRDTNRHLQKHSEGSWLVVSQLPRKDRYGKVYIPSNTYSR